MLNLIRGIILELSSKLKPKHKVDGWYVGPIVGLKNYSQYVALAGGSGELTVALQNNSELDALCIKVNELPNKLVIDYILDGNVIASEGTSDTDPLISVCFQRKWDSWNMEGRYQQYRWYYAKANVLKPGTNQLEVDFTSQDWSDVLGGSCNDQPKRFMKAKDKVGYIYITFGFSGGRSHGILNDRGLNYDVIPKLRLTPKFN